MSLTYSRKLVDVLRPHFKPAKVARLEEVLSNRRNSRRIILENVADPHNAVACLRSADSFGIQHVHLIESYDNFPISKQRNIKGLPASTDTGAQKWLTIHHHKNVEDCVDHLKAEGFQVLVSSVDDEEDPDFADMQAKPTLPLVTALQTASCNAINTCDLSNNTGEDDGPSDIVEGKASCHGLGAGNARIALAFGNETRGVSRTLCMHADIRFWIPTSGFTRSLNLSVATGASLAVMDSLDRIKSSTCTSKKSSTSKSPTMEDIANNRCSTKMKSGGPDWGGYWALAESRGIDVLSETSVAQLGEEKSQLKKEKDNNTKISKVERKFNGLLSKEEQVGLMSIWLLRDFGRGVDAFLKRHGLRRPDDF